MNNLENLAAHLMKIVARLEGWESFYNSTGRSIVSDHTCDIEIAQTWIYATDRLSALFMRPLPKVCLSSNPKKVFASECYQQWQKDVNEKESGYSDCFIEDKPDSHYGKHQISSPKLEESLKDYIYRLRDQVESKQKISFYYERNLSSFLSFLRQQRPHKEVAFIEHIFPRDMNISPYTRQEKTSSGEFEDTPCHIITRKVSQNAYPIEVSATAAILRMLCQNSLNGRVNTRMAHLETLGFCWVLTAASRLQVQMQVKDFEVLTIKHLDTSTFDLKVPTYFGIIRVPISRELTEYLIMLHQCSKQNSRDNRIFRCSQRTRERTLQASVETCELLHLNPITFQTFLSTPRYEKTRYRCKKSPLKTCRA